jgi:hypothetical protein
MGSGSGRGSLEVTIYAPCKKHKRPDGIPMSTQFCGCKPIITGHTKTHALQTGQWAQIGIVNMLDGATQTITDTSNATHSVTANSAVSAPTLVAGSGTTTPAVSDYKLQTQLSGTSGYTTSVTSGGSLTESGSSGTYTITGTITNGSGGNLTYAEIGMTVTIGGNVFLILHDLTNGASGYVVSNGGTCAITYTITNQ